MLRPVQSQQGDRRIGRDEVREIVPGWSWGRTRQLNRRELLADAMLVGLTVGLRTICRIGPIAYFGVAFVLWRSASCSRGEQ